MNDNRYNKKEKIILKEAEEEYSRRGDFQLIFPSDNYGYYK